MHLFQPQGRPVIGYAGDGLYQDRFKPVLSGVSVGSVLAEVDKVPIKTFQIGTAIDIDDLAGDRIGSGQI